MTEEYVKKMTDPYIEYIRRGFVHRELIGDYPKNGYPRPTLENTDVWADSGGITFTVGGRAMVGMALTGAMALGMEEMKRQLDASHSAIKAQLTRHAENYAQAEHTLEVASGDDWMHGTEQYEAMWDLAFDAALQAGIPSEEALATWDRGIENIKRVLEESEADADNGGV